MRRKLLSITLVFLLLVFCLSFAQIKTVALLKGFVFDKQSHTPIETEFLFVSNFNRFLVKSSKDGSFHIPISTSGDFFILSKKYFAVEPKFISISVNNSYSEKEVNLFFEPIQNGLVVAEINGFGVDSKQLTPEAEKILNFIAQMNKLNPGIFYRLEVSSNDVSFKTIVRKEKVGKKVKKVILSATEQANELTSQRIQIIRDFISQLQLPQRNLNYVSLPYSPVKLFSKRTSKIRKSKEIYPEQEVKNLRILVDRVIDFKK